MSTFDEQDLHRLVKQVVDSGAVNSIEEARALFAGYGLDLEISEGVAELPAYQIALLTAVALGRRVFLGGVSVRGPLGARLAVPLPFGGKTLGDAIRELGALPDLETKPRTGSSRRPTISFSATSEPRTSAFHVRPSFAGWRGGVVPIEAGGHASTDDVMPLAPMLGAALSINEAYSFVSGNDAAAGHRSLGLSLWDPSIDWSSIDRAPPLEFLPSQLWLIGLGHLGQAYLWALGLLPYGETPLSLVLQDIDVISRSTESTSILTDTTLVGIRKTRAMASWAERRGFLASIQERRFDCDFRRQTEEPAVALCGVDNAAARRAFDHAGFPLVIEAGLGFGHRDFRTFRLHTLPGARSAAELWRDPAPTEDLSTKPAYQRFLSRGELDQCGVTLLAGKAVGAPFVGAVAATLVVSEVLRLLHGGPIDAVLDVDLQSLEHRTVVLQARRFTSFNPGFVAASAR